MTSFHRRSVVIDCVLLTLLCLVAYGFGLTDHGLTNTQESTRLTAALEMQQRGDLVTPTLRGEPYIAKPPVMYWGMMAIASVRDAEVGVFELRAVVAIGGWLGVLATYFVGRVLLRDDSEGNVGEHAAFWGSAALAVGVLYVRSSRIGELDILMVPSVVVAMLGVFWAWRSHVEHRRTSWPAVALAVLASMIAALTKGPVPTAVIFAGAYGAMLARAASIPIGSAAWGVATRLGVAAGAVAVVAVAATNVESVEGSFGLVVFAIVGGVLGGAAVALIHPVRMRVWLGAFGRTHPWLVLGAGFAAVWAWLERVERDVGAERLAALKEFEIKDNLRLLVAESPINNLEFFAYGLGPASVACIIALYWIARDRPPLTRGKLIVLTWVLLGLVVFSTMGKGVARYLTPLWPATALLGGWWFVSAMRDFPRTLAGERAWRVVGALVITGAAVGQAWWYGHARDEFYAGRSPRDFIAEMRGRPAFDRDRVGTWGFETPAVDYYLGYPTWEDRHADFWVMDRAQDRGATPVEVLIERMRAETEPYFLLALADTRAANRKLGDIRARLREEGVPFRTTSVDAEWTRPPDGTPLELLILNPPGDDRVTELGNSAP